MIVKSWSSGSGSSTGGGSIPPPLTDVALLDVCLLGDDCCSSVEATDERACGVSGRLAGPVSDLVWEEPFVAARCCDSAFARLVLRIR